MAERLTGPELLDYCRVWMCDLDGLLANTHGRAIEEIYEDLVFIRGIGYSKRTLSDRVRTQDDYNSWYFLADILKDHQIDKKMARTLNATIWNRPYLLLTTQPVPGSQPLIRLASMRHKEIFIATSRPGKIESVRKATNGWCNAFFPEIPPENIRINMDSNYLSGAAHKAKTALFLERKYGPVLAFEDFGNHAEEVIRLTQDHQIFIILVPYAKIPIPEGIKDNPRVFIIERSEGQGIKKVDAFLTGSHNVDNSGGGL